MAPLPGSLHEPPERLAQGESLVANRQDVSAEEEVHHYQVRQATGFTVNGREGPPRESDAGMVEQLHAAILETCRNPCLDAVRQLLEAGADPNAQFKYKRGLHFTGTALTLAVKLSNRELVELLIEAHANPDSKYSFKCGAEQVINSVPACGAAISQKKLGMLRLLHEHSASLQGRLMSFDDKPNGTLLYEACYWGCLNIIRWMLKRCHNDLELAVAHQDNLKDTMTPLHIAAWKGHCEVVEDLLKHNAQIGGNDEKGRGPGILADAIDMGHVDITRLLVKSSADIFQGEVGCRGIDYVMSTNNIVIIAAVAAGLGASPNSNVARRMLPSDLVNFLMTPNCEEIFDAIFRQRSLLDWKGRKRVDLHNAQILDRQIQINFAEGPEHSTLMELFDKRKRLDAAEQEKIEHSIYDEEYSGFMAKLMPGRNTKKLRRTIRQVPIETRQCILADIHNNVQVVWATANGPNAVAFDHPGAKAMVMYGWGKAKTWYTLNFIFNLCLASIFLVFAILINHDSPPVWRHVFAILAFLLWIWNLFNEVMQMTGLFILGHFGTYMKDPGNYVDITRLLLTVFSIVMVFGAEEFGVTKGEVPLQKIFMALVTYFLWSKVLYCQRGFDTSGQYMLPILEAVQSIWPFLFVMVWPTIGFVNCYYMLGVYPEIYRAFSLVYRMGYVGDFDLEELEDIDPHFTPTEGNPLVTEVIDPVFTHYHWFIVVLMMAVTMFFAIVMMNILIGVLSEQYNSAYSNRHRIFLQTRARIGFDHYAMQMALNRLNCCRRGKRRVDKRLLWGGKTMSKVDESRFLWYCRPKNMEELGLPDEDDDDSLASADNVHDLLKVVLNDLATLKNEVISRFEAQPSYNNTSTTFNGRATLSYPLQPRLDRSESIESQDRPGAAHFELLRHVSQDLADFKAEFRERMSGARR